MKKMCADLHISRSILPSIKVSLKSVIPAERCMFSLRHYNTHDKIENEHMFDSPEGIEWKNRKTKRQEDKKRIREE